MVRPPVLVGATTLEFLLGACMLMFRLRCFFVDTGTSLRESLRGVAGKTGEANARRNTRRGISQAAQVQRSETRKLGETS